MGRLLDNYAVIQAVDKHTNDDGTLDDDISVILEEVPTAFDKEKVIEELDVRKKIADQKATYFDEVEDIQNMDIQDFISISYQSAIGIVEKGGVD